MRLQNCLVRNPELAEQLYLAASEIVDDFDDYGAVLQGNQHGKYDRGTAVEKLRAARDAIASVLQTSVS